MFDDVETDLENKNKIRTAISIALRDTLRTKCARRMRLDGLKPLAPKPETCESAYMHITDTVRPS